MLYDEPPLVKPKQTVTGFLPTGMSFHLTQSEADRIGRDISKRYPMLTLLPVDSHLIEKLKTRPIQFQKIPYTLRDRKGGHSMVDIPNIDRSRSHSRSSSVDINEENDRSSSVSGKKKGRKKQKKLSEIIQSYKENAKSKQIVKKLPDLFKMILKQLDKKQDKRVVMRKKEKTFSEKEQIEIFNEFKPRMLNLSTEQINKLKKDYFTNTESSVLDFHFFQYEKLEQFQNQLDIFENLNKLNPEHKNFIEEQKAMNESNKEKNIVIQEYTAPFESKDKDNSDSDSNDDDDSDDDLDEDNSLDYQQRIMEKQNHNMDIDEDNI